MGSETQAQELNSISNNENLARKPNEKKESLE